MPFSWNSQEIVSASRCSVSIVTCHVCALSIFFLYCVMWAEPRPKWGETDGCETPASSTFHYHLPPPSLNLTVSLFYFYYKMLLNIANFLLFTRCREPFINPNSHLFFLALPVPLPPNIHNYCFVCILFAFHFYLLPISGCLLQWKTSSVFFFNNSHVQRSLLNITLHFGFYYQTLYSVV